MTERSAIGTVGLLKLLAWFSPAMPTGAYSYSHGLEWAVETRLVGNPSGLQGYVEAALRHGTGRMDAILLRAAYDATLDRSFAGHTLGEIAALAGAMRGTRELALESTAQGRALLTVLVQAWPAPALLELAALCRRTGVEPAHACVAGVAAAAHGLPLHETLLAFVHAFAANLVSAGVRLIPLGQTDGQRITSALAGATDEVAREAMSSSLDDLGTATPMIDWCSMRHETQYTRLFRS